MTSSMAGRVDFRALGLRGLPIATLGSVVILWELIARWREIPTFILPPPSLIVSRLVEISGTLISHASVTMVAIGLGYLVGTLVGLVLAVLMTMAPLIRSAFYPIVIASQTTPKIAIAPLLIIWFGVGMLPKVIIVALLAFFPVLINTMTGLESADRSQLELMRSVNASQRDIYWHIRLPASIPYIFAGLRLALTVSIIGAIVGEWVASNRGLGYLLVFYNAVLRTPDLFAVLLVLVTIASTLFFLLGVAERRLSWEARMRTAGNTVSSVSTASQQAEASL